MCSIVATVGPSSFTRTATTPRFSTCSPPRKEHILFFLLRKVAVHFFFLAGHKAVYVPDAVAHHVGSETTGGQRGDFSCIVGTAIWQCPMTQSHSRRGDLSAC